jgi:hypothetical protein
MRKRASLATIAIAILLTSCRTDDVLKSSGDFKAGNDRLSQLAGQVSADYRGSCVRRLSLQHLRPPAGGDYLPKAAKAPVDETAVAGSTCSAEFQAAKQLKGTFDKVTAYYAQLNAAATGKTPDFDVAAGTTALKKAELLTDQQAGVIDAVTGKLATYLVAHARVVAVQAAVRAVDPTIQQVDKTVQAYFDASAGCAVQLATYKCNLQPETDAIKSVYEQYFDALSTPNQATTPSLADRFAIVQLVRDRDTLFADQAARVDRGTQLAEAFHQMAIKHHKLLDLIERVPDAGEALLDRL